MKPSAALEFFFLTLIFASVSANIVEPVHIRNHVNIIRPDQEPEYKSTLPKIYGVRSCGGLGNLVSVRSSGCNPGKLCHYPANNELENWEIEFIAGRNATGIGMKILSLIDGTTKNVYERALPLSEIQAGERIVVSSVGYITEDYKGKKVTFQYSIVSTEDNTVQVCSEIDTKMY